MYCSGCGSQLQTGLNYCSRCGRRVAEDQQGGSGFAPTPPVIAAITAGVGFFCFMLVLRVLTRSDVPPNQFIPISFVYFSALFGICFMILRHGSAAIKNEAARTEHPEQVAAEPVYIRPANTAQLPEPSDLPASVTEHTTRTLEKTPVRRS